MIDAVYKTVGAALGTAHGTACVLKTEFETVQGHADANMQKLARFTYALAGALSGIASGVSYALTSLWWWLTEDEIKLKLLQGSPIRFKLRGMEPLVFSPSSDDDHHQQNHLSEHEHHADGEHEYKTTATATATTTAAGNNDNVQSKKKKKASHSAAVYPSTPERVVEEYNSPRVLSNSA